MNRPPRKLSTLETMEYKRLMGILRRVRARWRAKLLLRGLGILMLLGLVTMAAASWGLDLWGYRPLAAIALSLLTYGTLAWAGWRFVIRPVIRRVPDRAVALYVEEQAPEIQAALLSAVEFGAPGEERERDDISPEFIDQVVHQALARGRDIEYGKQLERQELRKVGGFVGAATMVVAAAVLVSPSFLRDGVPLLLRPWGIGSPTATPYSILVEPGHADIARGADQTIRARLDGFDSESVRLAVKAEGADEWERVPMSAAADGAGFVAMVLGVGEATDYFVEASGIRSPIYRLGVVEVPYVERLDLELTYPQYSGLSPETREDAGDIAALSGTRVRVRAHPTVEVPAGRLVLEPAVTADDGPGGDPAAPPVSEDAPDGGTDGVAEDVETIPLQVGDGGALEAGFTIRESGFYRVELEGWDGAAHDASRRFVIEVLEDQPPTLSFDRPGRDLSVSSIEEVFTEVVVEDDFGIRDVEIRYTVNGENERGVSLYTGDGGPEAPLDLTAGHTFYLEEEILEPGDFIAYWARATDNRSGEGGEHATDIYFLEVRPFDRDYRQSQQGGMGGGGGGGAMGSDLSRMQRDIVAATFKLVRDRDRREPAGLEVDLETLAESQASVRDQTLQMGSQMGGLGQDQGLDMARLLAEAGEAMGEAAERLRERDPEAALAPEQRALQKLQRVEAGVREMQLSMQQGGGGGQGALDDALEMFELEMEELRNQYESVRRQRQDAADDQVDETLQRLTELARRQQQEIERQRARADRQSAATGGTGDAQRRLADEADELARRLERLARDRGRRELQDAANRLRDATDAMRRAAARGGEEATGDAGRALRELENARRLLDRDREGRLERDLADARDRVERMRELQRQIEEDVEGLGRSGGRTPERMERLMERKDALAEDVRDLEAQLDRMGRSARGDQLRASRELEETAEWIRDSKLSDKVRYSKGVVQERDPAYARGFEEDISEDLRSLEERVETASGAVERSREERLAEAVEETRELVRRLESFEERQRAAEESRRLQRRPGQETGERGRDGDEGRGDPPGQTGQAGETGESGESGPTSGQAAGGRLGGSASGPPGARQLGRELRERIADARELREALGQEGLQTTDLDRAIASMEELAADWQGTDRGLAQLRADVIDDLKLFEFWLRRVTGRAGGDRPQLAGTDAVPEGYRDMVERYFRSLAEEPETDVR